MTQQTKIEWTDFTVNFWEGCQKVGPGCDHCYAEARDTRFTGGKHWGPVAPRRKVKTGIAKLRKINREATQFHSKHGHWPRVFCSSLSDIFDNAVDPAWRAEAFKELTAATNTRPQLLTKRIGNVFQMVPASWLTEWPQHIGLMITVVNQPEAVRDIPKLLDLKASIDIPWVGLSMEPLLGPVDLTLDGLVCLPCPHAADGIAMDPSTGAFECCSKCDFTGIGDEWGIDWVIVGGESGHNARPTHPDWIRSLRDQCEASGTPFLFKQIGEWTGWEETGSPPYWRNCYTGAEADRHGLFPSDWDNAPNWDDGLSFIGERHVAFNRVGKGRAGRLLDGREWNGVPT